MVGKSKPRTKAQQSRFDALKEQGCVLCREMGLGRIPPEIHHITDCGRRLGHDYTIPLCCWHHRGTPWTCDRPSQEESTLGPSLARNKRAFVSQFGTEREILDRVENQLSKEGAI